MKKFIIAIVGLAFTLQMVAQKVLVIHKKDGSSIEVPFGSNISFTGKAKVNDNEYTRLSNINLVADVNEGEKPYLEVSIDERGTMTYGNFSPTEGKGLLYSTTTGVTIENGKSVVPTAENKVVLTNLEFNTTYYLRSYVTYQGNVFYSKETPVTTGLPSMSWYGVKADPEKYKRTGYVHPTDVALEALFSKYSDSFESRDSDLRIKMLEEIWLEYLSVNKAEELAAKCSNKLECKDGTIYQLDEIGDDFMMMFDNVEANLKGNEGLIDTLCANYTKIETIVCDASLNVPNNTYYVFEPTTPNARPTIVYLIDRPMLAGRTYEVQITLAPNTYAEEGKPNFLTISHLNGNLTQKGKYSTTSLAKNYETDAVACETLTYTFTPSEFGENAIQIESRGIAALKDKYDLSPRIASINVKSVK